MGLGTSPSAGAAFQPRRFRFFSTFWVMDSLFGFFFGCYRNIAELTGLTRSLVSIFVRHVLKPETTKRNDQNEKQISIPQIRYRTTKTKPRASERLNYLTFRTLSIKAVL